MLRRVALGAVLLGAACTDDTSSRTHALTAYCEATVDGVGVVDVEGDYLPHVVNCENGNAAPAALEVQAIAARSYLYHRLATGGSIGDGTGDQVYTCGREPGQAHFDAVRATSGLVLRYPPGDLDAATQVAAFYVAGALQEVGDPDGDGLLCQGGTTDPTGTEGWVTYNQGLSGDDIHQTALGFVDPANHANRGCMSQNGSDCLAEEGLPVVEILRFYYGEDIGIAQAEGPCVEAVDMPDADAGPGGGGGAGGDATSGCSTSHAASATLLAAAGALLARMPRKKRRRRK